MLTKKTAEITSLSTLRLPCERNLSTPNIMPRSPRGASLKPHGFALLRYFRRIFY